MTEIHNWNGSGNTPTQNPALFVSVSQLVVSGIDVQDVVRSRVDAIRRAFIGFRGV